MEALAPLCPGYAGGGERDVAKRPVSRSWTGDGFVELLHQLACFFGSFFFKKQKT